MAESAVAAAVAENYRRSRKNKTKKKIRRVKKFSQRKYKNKR